MEEFIIRPEEYPDWAKSGEFDAAILYDKKYDKNRALAFKDFLERIVLLDDDQPLRMCLYDELTFSNSELKQWDLLWSKCTFVFVYISDTFLKDITCNMIVDELILATIEESRDQRWKVIPVFPYKTNVRIPFGLKALNGISLTRLDYLEDIETSLCNINLVNIINYDRYFAKNITSLFSGKRYLRKERECVNQKKLRRWIITELYKRLDNALTSEEEGVDEDWN